MKLVATLADQSELSLAAAADVVELRFDLGEFDVASIRKERIATIRRQSDGGAYDGDEDKRLEKLVVLSRSVEYVDVECDAPDWVFDEVSCEVIESYHNFAATPSYDELRDMVASMRGDYFKIATMGRDREDVRSVVRLLLEFDNVVAFLMGERFAFTRVLSAMLGSPFVYCYVGEPKAPGQLSLDFAAELFGGLGLR